MNRTVLTSFTILCLLLTLCLVGLALNTQTVKASETIHIRADGSIDGPANITTVDYVTYYFNESNYDEIVVERDNIVIDGAGYTLQGTGNGNGMDLSDRKNVTIKNMEIKLFYRGIKLLYSLNNSISGNNITANDCFGIQIGYSSNNTIFGNNITNNRDGISLKSGSNYNSVSGNNITNNEYGVSLFHSSSNTLRNNDASNNTYNFDVYGWSLSDYIQDIDISNTANGKPVYYWVNRRDMAAPLDPGYVALVNCTNITVQNLNLTKNGQGILLAFTTNSTITKNNGCGVRLDYSSNNSISGNNITNNDRGIHLHHSSNNSISGNNITNNYRYGIWLLLSSNYNSISGNNITNNGSGILLDFSSNNNFYHNNFIDNAHQVHIFSSGDNYWDDGYPSGGNYYSDYSGVDLNSGPYQHETGSDGIGDVSRASDNYPLMGMFNSFNTSLDKFVNVVSNSMIEDFQYFKDNSTIKMFVSNMTSIQTCGFCRVTVPHALMNVTNIEVIIDNGTTPLLYHNYTLYDNGTHRWIYFAYEHSTHKIDIIPEFQSFLILPLFMIATLLAVVVYKRKHV